MKDSKLPTYDQLMNPLIKALHSLGGSGTIKEIDSAVIDLEHISDRVANIPHGSGSRTEVSYRLAWTRTYLKKFGILENSKTGVWSFAVDKDDITKVDPKKVVDYVHKISSPTKNASGETDCVNDSELDDMFWRDELGKVLSDMSPSAFEKLAQRILREAGFYQVVVTGKSRDGGIDGHGILKIAGLVSFKTLFQCKRWKNSVSSSEIRDFRGAMQGRADKGIFITTGTFTKSAMEEASRDGVPLIDLIDGEALLDKIKELGLGVKINLVEEVKIDHNWFKEL
jgi:restriction system protein